MRTFDLAVLWIAAVGQIAFVGLWATQRWWSSKIGRALMAKSFSLALLLAASLWSYYRGPLPTWVGRSLLVLIATAICVQFMVLSVEVVQARRRN